MSIRSTASSSILAFFNSRSISDELSPVSSSVLASSISSGDIFAIRRVFSSSMLCASSSFPGSLSFFVGRYEAPWSPTALTVEEFGLATAEKLSSWPFDNWAALRRLNAEGLLRFRCAGKPVVSASFLVILGGEGGFPSRATDRSLISPRRPMPGPAVDVGLDDFGASVSSSEERLM